MHQITIREAESQFASILRNVLLGEEIIVTDHDTPVMKLSPIAIARKKTRAGFAKGMIGHVPDDFNETPEDFKDYL